MLTVAKVGGAAAATYADYLEGKTQAAELGDYYLRDGERVEAPGRWASGAQVVGCDPGRAVDGDTLRELMAVRHPDTREALRPAGGNGASVAALDATFSAPKSVSAVWALADPAVRESIERAHETAIDRALAHAVDRVPMIRRRVDPHHVVHDTAAELVATSWRHTTARGVDGRPPDPQLHSHVLLHAAVRMDGRVVAIDSRAWLVHRREIGAAYRTELARELVRLGYGIERGTGRGGRYFEIAGVPQPLLDRWSARHHQVTAAIEQRLARQRAELTSRVKRGGPEAEKAAERLAQLDRYGQLAPREERSLSTLTRSGKTPATRADLDRHWRDAARTLHIDTESLRGARVAPGVSLPPASSEQVLGALTEFDATFRATEARAVALEQNTGLPIGDALAHLDRLQTGGDVLRLQGGALTTRTHRAREHATVGIASRLAATHLDPLPATTVDRETRRLDRELAVRGGRLAEEQASAIRLACGNRQVALIEGQAGTGKSTTLTGIARAHHADGREVIVTSTAGLAAQRLAHELQDAGVPAHPYSTAALHTALLTGRLALGPDTTVVHDEAALASTREQHKLLTATGQSGARLIVVGDPQQNPPVGAGGLWPHLQHTARAHDAHAELTVNQRARDRADQRDQRLWRDGEHDLALRGLAARQRLHLRPDARHAEDSALERAHADRYAGRTTVVIVQTSNEHLDALNARAQAIRQHAGELGRDALPVPGRPYALHAGDQIQIRRTVEHPTHGPLRNGTVATITHVDPGAESARLTLAGGGQLDLTREQLALADMRLAYVQHPFPAQGITTDTAHLIAAEHATRHGTYVAITRARHETHIHAPSADDERGNDRIGRLAHLLSRDEPELPSIATPLAHENNIANRSELAHRADDRATSRGHDFEASGASFPQPAEPLATLASDMGPDLPAADTAAVTGDEPRAPKERIWPGASPADGPLLETKRSHERPMTLEP